jgi:DNA repair exonuclease SbcCD ATPase subunit
LEEEFDDHMELQQALHELGMQDVGDKRSRESMCSMAIATRSKVSQLQSQIVAALEDVAKLALQMERSSDGGKELSRRLQLVQQICLQVETLEGTCDAHGQESAKDALKESAQQKLREAELLNVLSRAHAEEEKRCRHEV